MPAMDSSDSPLHAILAEFLADSMVAETLTYLPFQHIHAMQLLRCEHIFCKCKYKIQIELVPLHTFFMIICEIKKIRNMHVYLHQ